MPSDVRKPNQNWWVDQRLRTRGMPTRSSDRGLDPTEGFGANHFSHVRIRTLRLLEPGFHHPHLVDVLDQPFRAGIAADDAFPARLYGNLAPWPSLRFGQLHVDESALAIAAAPAADRVVVGRAAIGKRFDGVEAAETGGRSTAPCI